MSHRFKFSLYPLILAVLVSPAYAESAKLTQKQKFAQAVSYQADAPERTVELLQELAKDGNTRAMDRLAYLTFKGLGTEQNTAKSIELYQKAITNQRTSSLVSLGKVYMSVGKPTLALKTLHQASQSGHEKADSILAWAHATGRFGDLSKGAEGFVRLRELAGADNRDAQMYLLDASARRNKTPPNISEVIARLHDRHDDGDVKAAEALLRYYRLQNHPRGTLNTRAALLKTPDLREKIRVEEGLHLAAVLHPKKFWTLSESLVQSAPESVYARGLSVAAKINKNAYVRILQKELRQLGYKVGRNSAYMNAPLIRAVNKFCRDHKIYDECRLGPLKSRTIKAVAKKLAQVRKYK